MIPCRFRRHSLAACLALAAIVPPAFAQHLALEGPPVDLTAQCGYEPKLYQVGPDAWVALWTDETSRRVWGRSGSDPWSLGPATPLTPPDSLDSATSAPQPGGFAVLWQSADHQGFVQLFRADLSVLAGPIPLGEVATLGPPVIAARADGELVVAYQSGALFARRMSATGTWLTPPIEVSGSGTYPQVAFGDDAFVVAWENGNYRFRGFDASGVAQGGGWTTSNLGVNLVASGDVFLVVSPTAGAGAMVHPMRPDGFPAGPAVPLPLEADERVMLAAGDGRAWAAATSFDAIVAVELDPLTGRALAESTQLVAPPHGAGEIALAPAGDGFALAWWNSNGFPFPAPACTFFDGAQAAVVRPQPFEGVDVPAADSLGLGLFALLLVAAAAWRLRA